MWSEWSVPCFSVWLGNVQRFVLLQVKCSMCASGRDLHEVICNIVFSSSLFNTIHHFFCLWNKHSIMQKSEMGHNVKLESKHTHTHQAERDFIQGLYLYSSLYNTKSGHFFILHSWIYKVVGVVCLCMWVFCCVMLSLEFNYW